MAESDSNTPGTAGSRLEGPVPGSPFLTIGDLDLATAGYVREEWLLAGTATAYTLSGERRADGCWQARRAARAPFKTRLVVYRPEEPARFNGAVVVEWLNVSGGLDACPDWLFLHRHLMREGAAWVGVTAHVAIAAGLLARAPRWRAAAALALPPLAPYWALRERMRVRAGAWIASVAVYVVMRLLARA